MKDLTKPRGWKSRLSAIVLSVVIALAFMPSLGAVDQAKAYEDWWGIEGGEYDVYPGESCTLRTVLEYDGEYEPEDVSYEWYREHQDNPEQEPYFLSKPDHVTTTPELEISNVTEDQCWQCIARDKYGDQTLECYFYVHINRPWYIDYTDDDDSFYYDVEEGQNIEMNPAFNIIFEEGYSSSNIKFKYQWNVESYPDEDIDNWINEPIDGATQKKYVAKNVKESTRYRLDVIDQYGNEGSVYIYLIVITADQKKADKVTEAIDKIKDIANITLADKAGIMAAKAAYDALSLDQKNLLYTSDINKLMEAIKKIETLEAKAKAEAEAKAKAEAEAKAKAEAEVKAKAEKKAIAKAKKLKVKGFKVKAATGKKATVTWKATKGAKGYQIMYSLNKKFKKAKKINIKKAKAKKAVITKLKAKKNYFVKIRPYSVVKKANGKNVTVYGKWSKVKIVKVK